jgi:hypothetical protein
MVCAKMKLRGGTEAQNVLADERRETVTACVQQGKGKIGRTRLIS